MASCDRRGALGSLCTLAIGLMTSTRVLAQPAMDPRLAYVAPDLRPVALQLLKMRANMPAFSDKSLHALRTPPTEWVQTRLSTVSWERRTVPGGTGQPDVTVFVINAKAGRKRGGIVYIHGGGFVLGSAESEISRSQELAQQLDCTIVSVEYRLAPETRYSGSLEDNYAALKWVHANADALGINPARIAIMGESAGGGHAALLAITARDRKEVPVAFHCLVYPMLDDRTGSTRRPPAHIGGLLWTAANNRYGWRSFLGRAPGSAKLTAGVPGRERNLAGLPPAWIGVGGIDLFMQEDVEYAERLLAAAVPTELLVIPGAFHGFNIIARDTASGKAFNSSMISALNRAL